MSGNVARLFKTEETWQQVVERYVLTRKADGLAPRTVKDYRYHLTRFFTAYPEGLNPDKAKRCVLEYMSLERSPGYHNMVLKYLRCFFRWTVNEGILYSNPCSGIRSRKAQPKIAQHSPDVVKALLALPDQSTYTGLRNYALLLLSLDTGIRPREALSLRVEDVSIPARVVVVRAETAKTRVQRTLPISDQTAQAIMKLVSIRPKEWRNAPLFCSRDGQPLRVNSWYHTVKGYGEKIGADITPYSLRHLFALYFLRNNGNTFALQRIMGHDNLDTTKIYVALAQSDLEEQHELASPVNALFPKRQRLGKIRD